MSYLVTLVESLVNFFPNGSGHLAGLGLVALGVLDLIQGNTSSGIAHILAGLGVMFGVTPAQPAAK